MIKAHDVPRRPWVLEQDWVHAQRDPPPGAMTAVASNPMHGVSHILTECAIERPTGKSKRAFLVGGSARAACAAARWLSAADLCTISHSDWCFDSVCFLRHRFPQMHLMLEVEPRGQWVCHSNRVEK